MTDYKWHFSVLGLRSNVVLPSSEVTGVGGGIEGTIIVSMGNSKDLFAQDKAVIQGDLHRLEELASRSHIKVYDGKCKILCLKWNNPVQQLCRKVPEKGAEKGPDGQKGGHEFGTAAMWLKRHLLTKLQQVHSQRIKRCDYSPY